MSGKHTGSQRVADGTPFNRTMQGKDDPWQPGRLFDKSRMDRMNDHESRQGVHQSGERGVDPFQAHFASQGKHSRSGDQVVHHNHQLERIERQRAVADKEREQQMWQVEHCRLDVRLERHPGERVWVPERQFAVRERHRGKVAERIDLEEKVFPEKSMAEQDAAKEAGDGYGEHE